jgi:hypothetical protein
MERIPNFYTIREGSISMSDYLPQGSDVGTQREGSNMWQS